MKTTKTKTPYRVRNWKEYNQALVQRGSLTIWFDQDAVASWLNHERSGLPGAPKTYTDSAIECALVLRCVYHLTLRATEGFLISITEMLGLTLPIPDYTTLCRGAQAIDITLPVARSGEPLHVLVDSSGVKIFGEGEWKVRKHGYSKRRTWRKLHIGVDAASQQIVAAVVSTADWSDSEVLPELLEQVDEELDQVSADGAYDTRGCYDAVRARRARAAIRPRRGAKIWEHGNRTGAPHPRDENLRAIRKRGRRRWKQEVGYHRRSLAETAFFRLKTLFGHSARSRTLDGQHAELLTRCAVLNRMTALGMPDSYVA